jgi:hypothetical protein
VEVEMAVVQDSVLVVEEMVGMQLADLVDKA